MCITLTHKYTCGHQTLVKTMCSTVRSTSCNVHNVKAIKHEIRCDSCDPSQHENMGGKQRRVFHMDPYSLRRREEKNKNGLRLHPENDVAEEDKSARIEPLQCYPASPDNLPVKTKNGPTSDQSFTSPAFGLSGLLEEKTMAKVREEAMAFILHDHPGAQSDSQNVEPTILSEARPITAAEGPAVDSTDKRPAIAKSVSQSDDGFIFITGASPAAFKSKSNMITVRKKAMDMFLKVQRKSDQVQRKSKRPSVFEPVLQDDDTNSSSMINITKQKDEGSEYVAGNSASPGSSTRIEPEYLARFDKISSSQAPHQYSDSLYARPTQNEIKMGSLNPHANSLMHEQFTSEPFDAERSQQNLLWTPEEELLLKQMRDAGKSWNEIAMADVSMEDLAEERRIQNRIAQRNYRKKLRRRRAALEEFNSTTASLERTENDVLLSINKITVDPEAIADQEADELVVINCVCGISDDRRFIVPCVICGKWQHIACYYELAQDIVESHECVQCIPRELNDHNHPSIKRPAGVNWGKETESSAIVSTKRLKTLGAESSVNPADRKSIASEVRAGLSPSSTPTSPTQSMASLVRSEPRFIENSTKRETTDPALMMSTSRPTISSTINPLFLTNDNNKAGPFLMTGSYCHNFLNENTIHEAEPPSFLPSTESPTNKIAEQDRRHQFDVALQENEALLPPLYIKKSENLDTPMAEPMAEPSFRAPRLKSTAKDSTEFQQQTRQILEETGTQEQFEELGPTNDKLQRAVVTPDCESSKRAPRNVEIDGDLNVEKVTQNQHQPQVDGDVDPSKLFLGETMNLLLGSHSDASIFSASRYDLWNNIEKVQALLPETWRWDVEFQTGCWTCTPLERDIPKYYPLKIAEAPVVLPVEYQWPPISGVNPPPDPRPSAPIDCNSALELDIIRDIFLTFEGSLGFYLLINGLLQIIVPEEFDTTWASSHLPHRYGGLKVCYIPQTVEATMLPSSIETTKSRQALNTQASSLSSIFRQSRPTSISLNPTLKLNDFIEARPKTNHRKEKFSGRIGLKVEKEGYPYLLMSSHIITEAILAKSHRDTFFGRGRDRFEKLGEDWNSHAEIWAGNEKIGTIDKSFDNDAEIYPNGFRHDVTIIKPISHSAVKDISSSVPDLGWLSRSSWNSLRQQASVVKILGPIEGNRLAKSVKCSRPSEILVVGEGIFLNQTATVGNSKSLKDHDISTWKNLISRALLYRVHPDFDPPNGQSGVALYAEGVRQDDTEGAGIVGFQSFVQRSGHVQNFNMEGPALERRLQLGRVAFYGAFEVPEELKMEYTIV